MILTSTANKQYLCVGMDMDEYAILQDCVTGELQRWMMRDSDAEVEILSVNEVDYELKDRFHPVVKPP